MRHILLTNDDGIDAPGLAALRRALEPLGMVLTLAPDGNRSAIARSITIGRPLHARETRFGGGYSGYALDGTPADCVRAAALGFFGERPRSSWPAPTWAPTWATTSPTRARCRGARRRPARPAGGGRLGAGQAPRHFDDAAGLAAPIVARVLADGLLHGLVLNVNLPDLSAAEVRGVRVTRLGCASVHERIVVETGDGASSATPSTARRGTAPTRPAPISRPLPPGTSRSRRCTSTWSTRALSSCSRAGSSARRWRPCCRGAGGAAPARRRRRGGERHVGEAERNDRGTPGDRLRPDHLRSRRHGGRHRRAHPRLVSARLARGARRGAARRGPAGRRRPAAHDPDEPSTQAARRSSTTPTASTTTACTTT